MKKVDSAPNVLSENVIEVDISLDQAKKYQRSLYSFESLWRSWAIFSAWKMAAVGRGSESFSVELNAEGLAQSYFKRKNPKFSALV